MYGEQRRPRIQRLGAVLWPSFLLAGVATTVFFAFIDPIQLAELTFPGKEISRQAGYTIGFFMFWSVTATSSYLTRVLLRSAERVNDPADDNTG